MAKYNVRSQQASSGLKSDRDYDPDAFMKKQPVWAFARCDRDHPRWSIRKCNSLYESIVLKLASFEGMTWQEICSASGGKRKGHGSNSHYEDVASLIKEAQNRLEELHRYEDQLFSLRLSGTEWLYGILEKGVFYVLWYDPEHEICPCDR